MKSFLTSLRIFIFMTIVLGVLYPIFVTVIGQLAFPRQAGGDLIRKNDQVIGSRLIAQKFESPRYFWPRPSAVDYNPLPSGGTNLGPTSADLAKARESRRTLLGPGAPELMLSASASGLDPHLSIEAAQFQVRRIAEARGVSREALEKLIHSMSHGRQLGLLGEPTINVLELNLALERN